LAPFIDFGCVSINVSPKSAIYTSDLKDYNKAVALFNDNQYASAQLIFDKIKSETGDAELKSDCAYYDASCAIRLNHANADEKMERFVLIFPQAQK
jgi:hypothetical protein